MSLSTTPIHLAALEGDIAALERALKTNKHLVSCTDTDGCTPLHYSSANGHAQAVVFLIDSGAKVNSADNFGKTSLHYAVDGNQKEVVELLINYDASVLAKTNNGSTPIDIATNRGFTECVNILKGGKTKATKPAAQKAVRNFSMGKIDESGGNISPPPRPGRAGRPAIPVASSPSPKSANRPTATSGKSRSHPNFEPITQEKPLPSAYKWGVDDISDWLEGLRFVPEAVIDAFSDNDVDGEILLEDITMQVLKEEFGMASFGNRAKLMKAIRKLKN